MYCAIDFGTSNSAIAVPRRASDSAPADASGHAADSAGAGALGPSPVGLVELEPGHRTMPTAVFYFSEGPEIDGPPRAFGRAAVAAYIEGIDGRLMRSMKSILGSSLVEQTTDVGGGRGVTYLEIIVGYLRHLKRLAEADVGESIRQVVLGRPVYFVDDDPARDALAVAALETAARRVGFDEIFFQYEPLAAAFDHERQATAEETVLVVDIGGGTSDFSVVRVGPDRANRLDRKDDILASHGVHIAGTDFDRRVELASVLPELGFGTFGRSVRGGTPRQVPSPVYYDLATWHLINTVYSPQRVAELRQMKSFYADPLLHARLMTVVTERLGHELAGRAEQAKIDVAAGGETRIDLGHVERGLEVLLDQATAVGALEADVDRITAAAIETVRRAGLSPSGIDTLYFTGGSTGLRLLADAIAAAFPVSRCVHGDRFASVAAGLGLDAEKRFGQGRQKAS